MLGLRPCRNQLWLRSRVTSSFPSSSSFFSSSFLIVFSSSFKNDGGPAGVGWLILIFSASSLSMLGLRPCRNQLWLRSRVTSSFPSSSSFFSSSFLIVFSSSFKNDGGNAGVGTNEGVSSFKNDGGAAGVGTNEGVRWLMLIVSPISLSMLVSPPAVGSSFNSVGFVAILEPI